MINLINATQQSILTRFLANIFLFLVMLVALLIATLELLGTINVNLSNINPTIWAVLGTGIGASLHLLGLNVGVTLSPNEVKP